MATKTQTKKLLDNKEFKESTEKIHSVLDKINNLKKEIYETRWNCPTDKLKSELSKKIEELKQLEKEYTQLVETNYKQFEEMLDLDSIQLSAVKPILQPKSVKEKEIKEEKTAPLDPKAIFKKRSTSLLVRSEISGDKRKLQDQIRQLRAHLIELRNVKQLTPAQKAKKQSLESLLKEKEYLLRKTLQTLE